MASNIARPKWRTITHYICNNGHMECFNVSSSNLLECDCTKWSALIKQAMESEGVRLVRNISLKILSYSDGRHDTYFIPYAEKYKAELRCNGVPFLVTLGSAKDLSFQAPYNAGYVAKRYNVPKNIPDKAPGAAVVDVILPVTDTEGLAFLYTEDNRKFTKTLGQALLFPDSLHVEA